MTQSQFDKDLRDEDADEITSRLAAIKPALEAQLNASKVSGLNHHSAHGLVEPEIQTRANAAKHAVFQMNKPFAAHSTKELRQRRRAASRH